MWGQETLTPLEDFSKVTQIMSKLLEIGPGRGDFLFYLAEQDPLSNIEAVEYKPKRFEKLAARVEKRGLLNIQLHLGDARVVLPEKFTDEEFDTIFILFSDPWPKRRHAKHRLFQEPFVKELRRILKPGGRIYVAHDDPRYVVQIREVFQSQMPDMILHEEGVEFTTFYAEKWKKEGRSLTSFSYEKVLG